MNKEPLPSFSLLLRQYRRAAGLTQEELAERAGMSAHGISNLERGERQVPRRDTVDLLATALGLGASEITALETAARPARFVESVSPTPVPIAPFDTPLEALSSAVQPLAAGGIVSYLLAEVVDGAAQWERHPAEMRIAVRRFTEVLQEAVHAETGVLVGSTRMPDSACALFTRASQALAAACALQRALLDEQWPAPLSLRVRAAVHLGEPELVEGGHTGPVLHRCALLCAMGHGGQVLVSQAAVDVALPGISGEISLRALGSHRLGGLERPEAVYQVLHPALRADFPPLVDAAGATLPIPPSSFVGREEELRRLEALLETARMVTLTGPGGVGKTRLALQAGAALAWQYPGGVYFADLSAISDPRLVGSAVAQVVGAWETAEQPAWLAAQAHLRGKRVLLLLDNCEQLPEIGPEVARLLAGCQELRVVATSRMVLRLRGEQELVVAPLPVPSGVLGDLHTLSQYGAVALFIERGRAVRPDLRITSENAPALAELCVRLDGLPLAIEMVAARCKLLSPAALLARLERVLPLASGARDLPARQRTLRAAIGWSYDLLAPAERELFRQVSVFVGGCSLESVEAVCPVVNSGRMDAFEGLSSLVEKSLLHVTETDEGEMRFQSLEMVREFGWERLEAESELAALEQQHVLYFLQLAETAEHELTGTAQAAWVACLNADQDNLRTALRRCVAASESWGLEYGARIVASLWRFLTNTGQLIEGLRWYEEILLHASRLPSPLHARVLYGAGQLAFDTGDYARSRELLHESLALRQERDDARGIAASLIGLGNVAWAEGDLAEAEVLYSRSLVIWRELGHLVNVAVATDNLGAVASLRHDYARAEALHREGLTLRRQLGDTHGIALSLYNLSAVASAQQDFTHAAVPLREAIALWQQVDARRDLVRPLADFALFAQSAGNHERAATLFAAEEILRRLIGEGLRDEDAETIAHGVEEARAKLSQGVFAAAWLAGQRMSLDDALAFALDMNGLPGTSSAANR